MMKKRDKIIFSIIIIVYFVSIFVEAMLADDRIIADGVCTALVFIESVLLIAYLIYFLHSYRAYRKKEKIPKQKSMVQY